MVGTAGLLAGEVSDVVLSDEMAPVDGDERLDGEGAEVGLTGELTSVPGLLKALMIGKTIMIDFHDALLD